MKKSKSLWDVVNCKNSVFMISFQNDMVFIVLHIRSLLDTAITICRSIRCPRRRQMLSVEIHSKWCVGKYHKLKLAVVLEIGYFHILCLCLSIEHLASCPALVKLLHHERTDIFPVVYHSTYFIEGVYVTFMQPDK